MMTCVTHGKWQIWDSSHTGHSAPGHTHKITLTPPGLEHSLREMWWWLLGKIQVSLKLLAKARALHDVFLKPVTVDACSPLPETFVTFWAPSPGICFCIFEFYYLQCLNITIFWCNNFKPCILTSIYGRWECDSMHYCSNFLFSHFIQIVTQVWLNITWLGIIIHNWAI